MDEINLYSSEKVYFSYDLAGIGSRFLAALIDNLILGAVAFALILFFAATAALFKNNDVLTGIIFAIVVLFIFLLNFGYFVFFETLWNGQTPGKKAARLRVIKKNGETVSFGSAFLRNIMRIIDMLPTMYALGFLTIFFSRYHQRVGDMVANTIVVREKKDKPLVVEIQGDITHPALPLLKQRIYLLTEKDFGLILHFFSRETDVNNSHYLAGKIAAVLATKMELEEADVGNPREFLRAIAAVFREK